MVAARNNAAWCGAVCRLHGLPVRDSPTLWSTPVRSPDFYPDAVTLAPEVTGDEVLAAVDGAAGCSVKDSFASLDLSGRGFRVLFDAEWIGCAPADPVAPPQLPWRSVATESDLALWAAAHGESLALSPALLADRQVRLYLADVGSGVPAGLALNATPESVGVSNLFGSGVSPDLVWADVSALAAATFPGLPVVGYESGEDLRPALAAGFRSLGPLRVWLH